MRSLAWLPILPSLTSCLTISEEELAFRKGGIAGCDEVWYLDSDGDQFGAGTPIYSCSSPGENYVQEGGDCDDENAFISPGVEEDCSTAFDDDCNGSSNGDGESVLGCTNWYADADSDGYGSNDNFICDCSPSGLYVLPEPGDCLDTDEFTNPDAAEICGDGMDNNCDGSANGCGIENPYDLNTSSPSYLGQNVKDYLGTNIAFGHLLDSGNAIVIAANGVDTVVEDGGAVYLLPTGNDQQSMVAAEEAEATIYASSNSSFGAALMANRDLNADGRADLIIGAPTGGGGVGISYVFWGPMSGEKSVDEADAVFVGQASGDRFGDALAVGPLVGDETYLAVGAPKWDGSGLNVGAVFVFDGQSAGEMDYSNADLVIEGSVGGGGFGQAIANLSDINGDGLQDLAVGANGVGSGKGQVHLFFSPLSFSVAAEDADILWMAEDNGAAAGSKVQAVGDLNGDGYTNLAIGAPPIDRVYIPSQTVPGEYALSESEIIVVGPSDSAVGSALAYAGDINGDSSEDLLLGGYIASTAYVAYGPLQGTVTLADSGGRLIGSGVDQTGSSVYSAGDLDGDGDSEILVGARVSTVTLNKQGAVFLIEGMGL